MSIYRTIGPLVMASVLPLASTSHQTGLGSAGRMSAQRLDASIPGKDIPNLFRMVQISPRLAFGFTGRPQCQYNVLESITSNVWAMISQWYKCYESYSIKLKHRQKIAEKQC